MRGEFHLHFCKDFILLMTIFSDADNRRLTSSLFVAYSSFKCLSHPVPYFLLHTCIQSKMIEKVHGSVFLFFFLIFVKETSYDGSTHTTFVFDLPMLMWIIEKLTNGGLVDLQTGGQHFRQLLSILENSIRCGCCSVI